jgi:hypothetical protein
LVREEQERRRKQSETHGGLKGKSRSNEMSNVNCYYCDRVTSSKVYTNEGARKEIKEVKKELQKTPKPK